MARLYRKPRRKKRFRWIKRIGLTLLILLAIASVALLGLWLFQLSNTQKWSSEVNASVINLFVSTLTFIITIAVTVYFNTQTQRLTLDVQEMNIEAMKFQARANIRDRIIEKRMEIYPKILEDLGTLHRDTLYISSGIIGSSIINKNIIERNLNSEKILAKFVDAYGNNPFISYDLRGLLLKYATWKTIGVAYLNDKRVDYNNKIITSNEYVEIEYYFRDRITSLIRSELQLKEVEEDIKEIANKV